MKKVLNYVLYPVNSLVRVAEKFVNSLVRAAEKFQISKQSVLLILVATLGLTSVLMNVFASFRPLYDGSDENVVWRAVSFSTIAISWIPFLVGDLLANHYRKRVAIGIPAFIFAVQALIWVVAILAGSTDEGWQNLYAGMAGNYTGLLANFAVFMLIKKTLGTNKWWTFMMAALISTVFGQLADNTVYMALSPFQWAGDIFKGGAFINFADRWTSAVIDGKRYMGWDSLFLKSAFEIGAEVLIYPVTLIISKVITQLPYGYEVIEQNTK